MSGNIVDVRLSSSGSQFTNTLSLTGHYDNGHFLIDLMPVKTEDEIAESAGWDGESLYLIQRFPDFPGKGEPRDKSLGFVEPSVFSRYATHALTSVLLALTSSNALAGLETGQDVVVLGGERKYPEENNAYKVSYLSSGDVEIEALCPGHEIGPMGTVPIEGFDGGFTRWTHKSNLTGISGTNDPGVLLVEYKRFMPLKGKLVRGRVVTGKILFRPEDRAVSEFRPIITEDNLSVMDYSCRSQLFPVNKGLMDQNYLYRLTNHLWNFDRNIIVADFAKRKAWLVAHGVPKEMKDEPQNVQPLRGRRIVIICGLFTISALSAVALWFGSRRVRGAG